MKYFRSELYELQEYIPGEQPSPGSPAIKLNTNENPYPPTPKIRSAVENILDQGYLRRYPHPYSSELRKEVAKFHGLDEEEILIVNGSDEGLALLFRAVFPKKGRLVIPYPTYSLYPILASIQMNEVDVVRVQLDANLRFPFDALAKERGNLLAFAHPNAPTGILEDLDALAELAERFPGMVLSDEAYIDFAGTEHSMIELVRKLPNLMVSRTFSKSYSLTGIRVGYLVGNKENIRLLAKLKDSYNVGMLESVIALEAIRDQKYLQETIRKIRSERANLYFSLKGLGFSGPESSANFLYLVPPSSISAERLYQKLKEKNIFIRYFSDPACKNYVRITIGNPDENKSLLEGIRDCIEKK